MSIGIQVVRDRSWTPYEPAASLLWLRSSSLVHRLTLGYDNLVADLYWIRAVVYYGGQRRTEGPRSYDLLYPLLDLTTSLDPRFRMAYRFGAIFLSERYPGGPGRPDQAIELLQRAIGHNPDRWEYPHDIGYVYYFARADHKTAAEWFKRASEIPKSPEWLALLAATTLTRGGERASSRLMWQQLLVTAEEDWTRQTAEFRLAQLGAMDDLDRLNELVTAVETRTGRRVPDWEALLTAGALAAVPRDPAGTPYALDPETGRVTLAPHSSLHPLPIE